MASCIRHALVLNLHQPIGNLEELLEKNAWEVTEILCAMDRIPRRLWGWEELGRVHLSVSGALLETLSRPDFQERMYGTVRLGDLLWHYQNQSIIEILGTGYYHPVLPLIPEADRDEQIARWHGIARHLFWRNRFQGFWPPEMGFSMELIPLLRRHGFRYVLVDAEHIVPKTPMSWPEIRYRPHVARHGNEEIIIIPRDRDLSIAQESGMEPDWFLAEARARTRHLGDDAPALVTTATDGDNGGWFRNMSPGRNFWEAFYQPLLERMRAGAAPDIRPTFLHEYLDAHGTRGEVIVRAGAWNTGEHNGVGFVQWTGSRAQRTAWARVRAVSEQVRARRDACPVGDESARAALEQAYWRVLCAETSCHFFWGEAWVDRAHHLLDEALNILPAAR